MVTIANKEDYFKVTINGFHKIWALKNSISIPKSKIVSVYQNIEELGKACGLRLPGTYIPWVITAGTFYKDSKPNFWDMQRKKNTIIIETKNFRYKKLYLEVKNPEEIITLLNLK